MSSRFLPVVCVVMAGLVSLGGCVQRKHPSGSAGFTVLQGAYLGQELPDGVPVRFADGIVSTGLFEMNSVFSPAGDEFYYSIADPFQNYNVLMYMRLVDNEWTTARMVPFSGRYSDFDPTFSSGGDTMFFISKRPLEGIGEPKDADIWMVVRTDTGWTEPENLGAPINSAEDEYYVSATTDGTLYFTSAREGGSGAWDIYRSRHIGDRYITPVNLGPSVNSQYRDYDPCVSRDESYLIFASWGRPDGYGGADLYISFRTPDGSFSEARNLGEIINTRSFEYAPVVSPDGEYLFFSRFGGQTQQFYSEIERDFRDILDMLTGPDNGLGNVYWMESDFVLTREDGDQ